MSNLSKIRVTIDLISDDEGTSWAVWTPTGLVTAKSPREVAEILALVAKRPERVFHRKEQPESSTPPVRFETVEEYLARGGKITQVNPPALDEDEQDDFLESLFNDSPEGVSAVASEPENEDTSDEDESDWLIDEDESQEILEDTSDLPDFLPATGTGG